MELLCLLGRVLFASLFILSAFQIRRVMSDHQLLESKYKDFGDDGGPAAKEFSPKLTNIHNVLSSKFWDGTPKFDVRHLVAALIVLNGLGGLLFVFGSSLGAIFLQYNLAIMTPLLFDFYNYNHADPNFGALLLEFSKYLSYIGALLFFMAMKHSMPRKQIKKKKRKAKRK